MNFFCLMLFLKFLLPQDGPSNIGRQILSVRIFFTGHGFLVSPAVFHGFRFFLPASNSLLRFNVSLSVTKHNTSVEEAMILNHSNPTIEVDHLCHFTCYVLLTQPNKVSALRQPQGTTKSLWAHSEPKFPLQKPSLFLLIIMQPDFWNAALDYIYIIYI